MAAVILTKDKMNATFRDLYISANIHNGYTNIGIYDNGYESLTVEELIELRSLLNSIILKIKFPSAEDGLPF